MKRYQTFSVLLTLLIIFTACSSKPKVDDSKLPTDLTQSHSPFEQISSGIKQKSAFEDREKFIMIEGSECIQRDNGDQPATLLILVDMPEYVDRGTAILNGWDLRYLHNDHEVRSLRAEITHSKMVTGSMGAPTLVFEVQGKLSDQNWDDAFEFCVYYTGMGYNSSFIDAQVEGDYNGIDTWALQTESEGAVSMLESVWSEGSLKGSDSVAVIPRGFSFQYDNEFECEFRFPPCQVYPMAGFWTRLLIAKEKLLEARQLQY